MRSSHVRHRRDKTDELSGVIGVNWVGDSLQNSQQQHSEHWTV